MKGRVPASHLSREERFFRMSALGIALSSVEVLPKEVRKKSRKPSRAELKRIDEKKKQEFISSNRLEDQKTRKNLGEALGNLSERMNVFDAIIGQYDEENESSMVDIATVSTPVSTFSEEEAEGNDYLNDKDLRLPLKGEPGYGKYEEAKAVIPAHSPQRFNKLYEPKYIPKLEDGDNVEEIHSRKSHVYHIRLDFWSELDINRLKYVYGFSNHSYGKEPIFLEMVVPGSATPYELVNTILSSWEWDNSHAYRLSSNTGLGLNRTPFPDAARHYEAEAFRKAAKIPCLAAFFLNKFSRLLVEYDLEGNHWQWEGTVTEVELDRKLDHIIVAAQGGGTPCQYAHQLMERYIMRSPDALTPPRPPRGGGGGGSAEKEVQRLAGLSLDESHRYHDVDGKYYESTKDHVDGILLKRYAGGADLIKARKEEQMVQRFQGRQGREKSQANALKQAGALKQTIQHDGRMRAAARHVSEGLAF